MATGSDSLTSSGDFEQFDTMTAAAAGMEGTAPSRYVVCLDSGVLVVKQSQGGTQRTITVTANVPEMISVTGFVVLGSSGCVPIKVYR